MSAPIRVTVCACPTCKASTRPIAYWRTAPDPADVIEPSRAASEVERVIEDFIAGEVGYMHPLMGEQAERLRIKLAEAGLLADPADRDERRNEAYRAQLARADRAEAEVAELRATVERVRALADGWAGERYDPSSVADRYIRGRDDQLTDCTLKLGSALDGGGQQ